MPHDKIDPLLQRWRLEQTRLSPGFTDRVLSSLGPSTVQVQRTLITGIASCLVALALSYFIAANVAKQPEVVTPPEFTLLTRGIGGLASL